MKLETNEIIDDYANRVGVSASLVRTNKRVEEMKQAQAEAQANQQAMMEEQASIQNMKELSQTKMDEDSALAEVMGE